MANERATADTIAKLAILPPIPKPAAAKPLLPILARPIQKMPDQKTTYSKDSKIDSGSEKTKDSGKSNSSGDKSKDSGKSDSSDKTNSKGGAGDTL